MIDLSGLDSLLYLVGIITIPAIVIFGILTYQRVQNSKFRHKRSNRRRDDDDDEKKK